MASVYELPYSKLEELPLDAFSTLTMTYTQDGFNELKDDIKRNGQLVPILLRDGKILDGRHRHQACMELGSSIRYKELGDIDDAEALDLVISNSINKATNTDAAKVEAYLMCKAKGIKQKDMPAKFSRLNLNYVRKLSFIDKESPEYLQVLLKQNMVRLYNKEFEKVEDYGTINGIWRTLKANKRLDATVIEVVPEPAGTQEYETDLEAYFNNAAAESEYWELYTLGKESGANLHPDTALGKKVAGLIKHKYLGN